MRTALLVIALLLGGTTLAVAPAGAQPPPGLPRTVKVFTLKKADAQKLRDILLTIFGRQGITVAVDDRTNSLVVSGDADTLEEIRKLIAELDKK
jgi:type II secretory pathway component GspD/PulD (secretin)